MSSGGPYGLGSGGPRLRPNLDVHTLDLTQPVGTGGIKGIHPVSLGDSQSFHPLEIRSPQLPSQLPNMTPSPTDPSQVDTQLTDQQISQLRSIGQRADALPDELKREYIQGALRDFQVRNIPTSAQHDVLDVIYQKGRFQLPRHKSVLSRIGQGLAAIESSGSGFASGYLNYLDKHFASKPGAQKNAGFNTTILSELSPWAQYHAIGAGFKDIAPAVHEGYTYADLVKSSNNKDSLAYQWAKPIGLGLSVVFDPLTYLSFGANTVGKEAAIRVMANQETHAYAEADKLIRAGHYGGDYNKLHEAAMDVKVKNGYAMTLGDAMDQLHNAGLSLKQEIRSTGGYVDKSGNFVNAGLKGKAGAWLAPTSAIGARGVRFAGKQIPGTARAGELTGAAVRGGASGVAAIRDLSAGVIPDWAARHVAADGLRSSALVKMAEWRAKKQTMSAQIGREVHDLQKVKIYPEKAASAPPVPTGHTRLFRGEGPSFSGENLPGWMQDTRGTWWTDSLKVAQGYAKGQGGQVLYADVPHDAVAAGKIGSLGAGTEYQIPHSLTQGKKPYLGQSTTSPTTGAGDEIAVSMQDTARRYLLSTEAHGNEELRRVLEGAEPRVHGSESGGNSLFVVAHTMMPVDMAKDLLEYVDNRVGAIKHMPPGEAGGDKNLKEMFALNSLGNQLRKQLHSYDIGSIQSGRTEGAAALRKHLNVSEPEQAAVNLSGSPEVLKVSPAARRDLMNQDFSSMPEGALKNLHNNISVEAHQFISHAVDAGADRAQLEHQWEYLSKHAYHDPLAALFDFKLKTATQVGVRDWTDHVLLDRRFAIPMYHGTEREAVEKAAYTEKPIASGALRPTHIGNRSVVMMADGLEHNIGKMDARDFVHGVIHDADGTPLNVSDIRQVTNSAGDLIWREKNFVPTGLGTKLLHEVPAGYQSFTHAGRRYAVLDPIADALREMHNPVVINPSLQKFMSRLNAPQNWWKIYATSPNPSFHVMNFLGAMWNNQLAGVYNPLDYVDAASALYHSSKESAAQSGEKFMFRTPQSTPKGRAALRTFDEAANRTGLGRSSFLFADIARGDRALSPDIEREIGHIGPERGLIGKVVAPPEGASVKQIARFYTTRRGRQATAGGLLATGNPLGLFLLAPEAARVGQKVTGTIEDVVRLAPFMKYSKDPVIQKVLHRYGPIMVDGMTHPRWTKAEQAAMYDIGASITQHFQFDYTNLTEVERHIAKTFFPFWSYYKNNFILQAQEVVKHPRSFAGATAMMTYISSTGQDLGPYASVLPQYFENLQAFQIPVPKFARDKLGLPHDQPLFLNPKMPFLSLNLIPPMWDIINDPHQTTSQRILETIAPVAGSWGPMSTWGAKLFLEAGTGHNLGLNRPIDFQRVTSNDYRQGHVPAPSWAKWMPPTLQRFMGISTNIKTHKLQMTPTASYILDQVSTPFINNLGKSVPVSGSSDSGAAKAKADMVSWITGVRLMPVDVLRLTRNEAYTMKNILESKQSDLRTQGKELNDKDYDILQNIKADLTGINDAYNTREGIKP